MADGDNEFREMFPEIHEPVADATSDPIVQAGADVTDDPVVTAFYTDQPERDRGGGRPFNQNRRTHGYWAQKKVLGQIGFDAIDRRTSHGRVFALRREQIFSDLGGKDALTQIQNDLVERYMRIVVLIDSLDAWLFQQPSLINKRRCCLYPIVRERVQLEDSALRLAMALGLERKPKPVPTLQEYLQSDEFQKDLEPDPSAGQRS